MWSVTFTDSVLAYNLWMSIGFIIYSLTLEYLINSKTCILLHCSFGRMCALVPLGSSVGSWVCYRYDKTVCFHFTSLLHWYTSSVVSLDYASLWLDDVSDGLKLLVSALITIWAEPYIQKVLDHDWLVPGEWLCSCYHACIYSAVTQLDLLSSDMLGSIWINPLWGSGPHM